jgi:hypothetical protein
LAITRCLYCDRHVQYLNTKFGRRMLFDAVPVPIGDVGADFAWMPGPWKVGRQERMLLAPVGHYSRDKRSGVRHVVTLHHCPPYQAAAAAAGLGPGPARVAGT